MRKFMTDVVIPTALAIASIAIRAWVIVQLWHWHVTPFGLPDLMAWHAIGLQLTMGLMLPNATVELRAKMRDDLFIKGIKPAYVIAIGSLAISGVGLLGGWLAHLAGGGA